MTGTPIVWVHGDALSPRNPALLDAPGAPAIFVFDDRVLARYRVSLKRVLFIYECLLELPVTIRRGDPAAEIVAFAREHGADRVLTTPSPAPGFEAICQRIEATLPVELVAGRSFADADHADLSRFSRYWRAAERTALADTGLDPLPSQLRLPDTP